MAVSISNQLCNNYPKLNLKILKNFISFVLNHGLISDRNPLQFLLKPGETDYMKFIKLHLLFLLLPFLASAQLLCTDLLKSQSIFTNAPEEIQNRKPFMRE